MNDSAPFPDDVPVDDAVEQRQSAADLDLEDPDDQVDEISDDVAPPLEADPGDWQEQHQQVDDADLDEERR